MKILIIGSGAREHALAWKLHQSRQVTELFCAPGNPGIAEVASCVPIAVNNIEGLLDFAEKHQIDLTIPGPEAPLVAGIVDAFEAKGLTIFGPSKKAASLEGSKVFSKNFMKNYHIPAAASESFTDYEAAVAYAETTSYPCVVKADGLAAGKGAIIVHDFKEAQLALQRCMLKKNLAVPDQRFLLKNFSLVKKPLFLLYVMEKITSSLPRLRITKQYSMATKGRTPAAWALTLLHRLSQMICSRKSKKKSSSRRYLVCSKKAQRTKVFSLLV